MKEEEEGDGGTLPYRLHTTLELDQLKLHRLQQPAAVTPPPVLLQLEKP